MPNAPKGTIRIGVGGWVFPPWRGRFYPEGLAQKRELEYAGKALTSIEINGTYYGAQKPESFAKWREETPEGFVFALKGPRFATNRRVLAEAGESVERFITGGLVELGDKLGPINWQFAATKAFDPDDFAAFLGLLPKSHEGRALRHAVEVRHGSFRDPDFVALLREHGAAAVLAGDSTFPLVADITAPFVYMRLMGTSEEHEKGYGDKDIAEWAERMRTYAEGEVPGDLDTLAPAAEGGPRDVFAYVISGHKPANPAAAQAMIRALEGS